MDERGRQSVLISARLRTEGRGEFHAVLLRDVSAYGAKVKSELTLSPEARIQIDLPNIGIVEAKVIWAEGGLLGVGFGAPIDPTALRNTISGEYKPVLPSGPAKRPL